MIECNLSLGNSQANLRTNSLDGHGCHGTPPPPSHPRGTPTATHHRVAGNY